MENEFALEADSGFILFGVSFLAVIHMVIPDRRHYVVLIPCLQKNRVRYWCLRALRN